MRKIKTKLNEWLNEQYKYDETKLNNLVAVILEKYPQINYGGCAVFARAFHNITGLPYMMTPLFPEEIIIYLLMMKGLLPGKKSSYRREF